MSNIEIKKSYEEINKKIKEGKAVVVTAEEMPEIVKSEGVKKAFEKVDVVTTGTFGIMCSSGAFLNFGHTKPHRFSEQCSKHSNQSKSSTSTSTSTGTNKHI